ncbi:MAG TPA: PKD domain-containing protein [Thermoanaerobaculia bacterium]|nr:PKD domain-containing protein [Thermoanaerobaculia bacterium]
MSPAFPSIGTIESFSDDEACHLYAICEAGKPIRFRAVTNDACNVYHWDFGDGTTSAEPEPVHVFAEPNWFLINALVSNAAGQAARTESINLRNDWYRLGPVIATPHVISIRSGETVEIRMETRFGPAPLGVGASCHGPVSCYTPPIASGQSATTIAVTGTERGVAIVNYLAYNFGRAPGSGPVALVYVDEPLPARYLPKRRAATH